jgi:membrane peptidoglycan carboxypeptidase
MLRQVVLSGTGRRAQLDGYSSAGKTGTAWKFDPKTKRVERSKYMSTFVGFAPVENPRFVIVVVMDEPQTGARDGGTVSAPVFRDIAQTLLTAMNVPHDLPPSNTAAIVDEVPEINAGETPTVSGPPEDTEKTVGNGAETKGPKKNTSPAKKESGKTPTGKAVAIANEPKGIRSGPAVWRSKPKTRNWKPSLNT